jgi:hypothetical protein
VDLEDAKSFTFTSPVAPTIRDVKLPSRVKLHKHKHLDPLIVYPPTTAFAPPITERTTHTMASPLNIDSSAGPSSAARLLAKEFKSMQTDTDIPGISCGLVGSSVFEWEVVLMMSEEQDSLYGGE